MYFVNIIGRIPVSQEIVVILCKCLAANFIEHRFIVLGNYKKLRSCLLSGTGLTAGLFLLLFFQLKVSEQL
jgi:hypothetical protein